VLELARTGADLADAITVHGSLGSARPAGAGEIKTRLLVCHGALDPHVPAELQRKKRIRRGRISPAVPRRAGDSGVRDLLP
jgi:dienelactone hydrolase